MNTKIPIFLLTHDRPYLLSEVIDRLLRFTDWALFKLVILDNNSTISNRFVISSYLSNYPQIQYITQGFNNVSSLQNSAINKFTNDLYIKLDDDIIVTKDWYKGFLEVYDRNSSNIGIGSVISPINGFSWVHFLEIMKKKEEFLEKFPRFPLIQGCDDIALFDNVSISNYLWSLCYDLDSTNEFFIRNRKIIDYNVEIQYSIGAIIYSHKFWQDMGGWKVNNDLKYRLKMYELLKKLVGLRKKYKKLEEQRRLDILTRAITGVDHCPLIDEYFLYKFIQNSHYKQYVTTQNLVYHFSYRKFEEEIMRKHFLKIKF